MIDPRVPLPWIALAAFQIVLHLILWRRSPWAGFRFYCLFAAASDVLWLAKSMDPYTRYWQWLVIPGALWRIIVATECMVLFTLDRNTSDRAYFRRRAAQWFATSVALVVLWLAWQRGSYAGLPTWMFAFLIVPRFWSVAMVLGAIGLWWGTLERAYRINPAIRNHAILLALYLVNQTVWAQTKAANLAEWFRFDAIQLGVQAGLLTVWVAMLTKRVSHPAPEASFGLPPRVR